MKISLESLINVYKENSMQEKVIQISMCAEDFYGIYQTFTEAREAGSLSPLSLRHIIDRTALNFTHMLSLYHATVFEEPARLMTLEELTASPAVQNLATPDKETTAISALFFFTDVPGTLTALTESEAEEDSIEITENLFINLMELYNCALGSELFAM